MFALFPSTKSNTLLTFGWIVCARLNVKDFMYQQLITATQCSYSKKCVLALEKFDFLVEFAAFCNVMKKEHEMLFE